MMEFNGRALISGLGALVLAMVATLAHRGGALGNSYQLAVDPGEAQQAGWRPPAGRLESVGCCLDDARGATWDGADLSLETADSGSIDLHLGNRDPRAKRRLPCDIEALISAYFDDEVWVGETREARLLAINAQNEYATLAGSSTLGPIHDVVAERYGPAKRILMTTGPRYSRPPSLLEFAEEDDHAWPIVCGERLIEPSGIALSPDGDTLFVADERSDELVWLRISRQNPAAPWSAAGKFARFPLSGSQRHLFRGLTVVWNPRDPRRWFVAGAGPDGLYFFARDARYLGKIHTAEPLSYIIPGEGGDNGYGALYVVAEKAFWKLDLAQQTR